MSAHLDSPNGLPTRRGADDEAWSSLVSTQLADVRKSAESWRNGLAAIVGAIAAFSIIKGPNDISGLDQSISYAVGVFLLLALGFGTYGAWSSLGAAYGTPKKIDRATFYSLGVDAHRLEMTVEAGRKLRCAKVATFITLVLLAIAVGLTWYGPRTQFVTLDVERRSGPQTCGKLLSSSNGHMDIKPSASEAVRLDMADLVKLTVVEKCR